MCHLFHIAFLTYRKEIVTYKVCISNKLEGEIPLAIKSMQGRGIGFNILLRVIPHWSLKVDISCWVRFIDIVTACLLDKRKLSVWYFNAFFCTASISPDFLFLLPFICFLFENWTYIRNVFGIFPFIKCFPDH